MTEYLSPPLEPSPYALLKTFVESMENGISGWLPNEASLDYRVGSAVSFLAAQLIQAAADGATDVYRTFGAKVDGIPPHEATAATGNATLVMVDTTGYTIPAGTIVTWLDGNGNRQSFSTLNEVVIAPGAKEATSIVMVAVEPGAEGNGIVGKASELAEPLAFVAEVVMTTVTNGGNEAETDEAYLARLVSEHQLRSPKPITVKDFNLWLLSQTEVGRVTTIAGFNPAGTFSATLSLTSGSNTISGLSEAQTAKLAVGTAVSGTGIPLGTKVIEVKATSIVLSEKATETKANSITFTEVKEEPGYVASWVGKANGEELSAEKRTSLEAALKEELLTGVIAKVLNPSYATINVAVTLFAWPGQNKTAVKEQVEAAIKAYLSPEKWGAPPTGNTSVWNNDPKVRLVNVEHAILGVVGTHYVSSLTLNAKAEDVLMTGVVALPKLGTLSVTVETG